MWRTSEHRRWGRGVVVLLAALLLAGCRGRKTLDGRKVSLKDNDVQAMAKLIEKATGLIDEGKEKQVLRLTKKDLPKAGQATVVATLKKVAAAETWEIQRVQRFGDAYFRATVVLDGDSPASVTVSFLNEGGHLVLPGGG